MLRPDLITETSLVLETATSTLASDFQLRAANSPTFIRSSAITHCEISTTSLLRAPKNPIFPPGETAKSIRVRQCNPSVGSTSLTSKSNPSKGKSIFPIRINCSFMISAFNLR
ncbi:unannotated protein [freshwater metagenome]|uniref:Unannotated protein n=1 Tax=freshwater metagenome TaxID=449393 RepID=A0A6J6BZX2_9ZZZZ